MRYVELVSGIKSSALGFGCAPVMGSVGPESARIAIRAALDVGITHFDLARSYGYGAAETFVGRQLKSVRDEVVIVTKFGIRATAAARWLGSLKPMVRALRGRRDGAASSGGAAGQGGRLARWMHQSVPLTPAMMRRSLEHSLRALASDRVEFLLMHEPSLVENFSDLAACAQDLKREGKIRGWGLASLVGSEPAGVVVGALDVLQSNVPAEQDAYRGIQQGSATTGRILFSPMRGTPGGNPRARLQRLLADFPNAVVLCSMFTPEHIRQNAAAAS
jgi:aryl-alcohol dehydrogenase-like predicted oxidoreductase